jgi:hypothetical protein
VKLPNETDFAIAKIRSRIVTKLRHRNLRAVYVTSGSPIKSSEDVQETTLARPRFADDGQHFPFHHLKGQVFKEHQVRLPGSVHLF